MKLLHSVNRMFNKITSYSKSGRLSLMFLNISQCLGIINDNLFKFAMAYLLIDTLGSSKASTILSATGAIYVIPFLLFSSGAGILADRLSKQKLLVIMKILEITLMLLSILAFATKNVWGCYTLLFFLATHSATFGPSKYGIIPELVSEDAVSRANGLITSFTYLAIIIGTFLASFLTEITERRYTLISIFCVLIAVGGFFSSLGIKQTKAQGSSKKMNFLFLSEIYFTLKNAYKTPHLLLAIFGSAYFLLVGAFTQLNIIPFAMQSLKLQEVAGGYLFLAIALGIALGSYVAGKVSRKRIELGLSCIAGFGIGFFFILAALFSPTLWLVILSLIMIGILGGMFVVPLDTFIQVRSGGSKRGQTIGAANFLGFVGVLIASFALYFFNQICSLSAAMSFIIMGLMTFAFSLFLSLRFSDLLFSFFSRIILYPLHRFKPLNAEKIEKSPSTVLILEKATWREVFLLVGFAPNIHLFIPANSKKWHWYNALFYSIHKTPQHTHLEEILIQLKEHQEKGIIPCLLLEEPLQRIQPAATSSFFNLFNRNSFQILFARFAKDKKNGKLTVKFEKDV